MKRLSLLFSFVALTLFSGCFSAGSSADLPKPTAPAQLVLAEDFEQGSFAPGWNGSYVREELYPAGEKAFVQMPGHGVVLEQYIPEGTDDQTPAQVGLEGSEAFQSVVGTPSVDEFYVEWQEYYPDDHDFADGAQKMLRFTYWKEGEERGPSLDFWNQYNNKNLQLFVFHPKGLDGLAVDTGKNTHLSVPTGRWVTFAVWSKLNTPGKADGFAYAFIDGMLIARMDALDHRGNDPRGFNTMWVGGNHTNQKKTVKASKRYIDNIKWYTTKPS